MNQLLREIRHNPLLWLLAFVPIVFVAQKLKPEAHTLLFVLSVLSSVPLAGRGGDDSRRHPHHVPSHKQRPFHMVRRGAMVYLIFAMTLYLLPPQVS